MNSTTASGLSKWGITLSSITLTLGLNMMEMAWASSTDKDKPVKTTAISPSNTTSLNPQQQSVVVVSALAAAGDIPRLNGALNQALDDGLKVSDLKEVLVQLYAYAGFPRSLNALAELMKVVEARKQRGVTDEPGRDPGRPIPKGDALLAAGKANQTKLSGSPVEGPLFEFAPVANDYLRAHLFGDIFERDNLDWQMRELATLGMLSALAGVEPQLQAHIRISMNTGVTVEQLRELSQTLSERVNAEMANRATHALEQHLASTKKP